jgi:hypothetical protein
MKKLIFSILAISILTGCGSSSGIASSGFGTDGAAGNFITTTVEVQSRYLYVLNQSDNTISAYILPQAEEGEGHSHARLLAQSEEEELDTRELEGSPYTLSADTLVDIAVIRSEYLILLNDRGLTQTYSIDAVTGLLSLQTDRPSFVSNPRRMVVSADGTAIAILGDEMSLHQVDAAGALSAPSFLVNTQEWTDVELNPGVGVASTASGAVGFQWSPGSEPNPRFDLALPGATRGDLVYAGSSVYLVNRQDNSISELSQAANGDLTLIQTFDLPAELSEPNQIVSLFDGEDLGVTDADTFVLLHPEAGQLESEGSASLDRSPNRLFAVPESEYVLVGHSTGLGSSVIAIEPEGPELLDAVGPGGLGPSGFGYTEISGLVTQTSGF